MDKSRSANAEGLMKRTVPFVQTGKMMAIDGFCTFENLQQQHPTTCRKKPPPFMGPDDINSFRNGVVNILNT